jgi:hypothetical protein
MHTTALVLGQKTDSASVKISVAPLIAYLMVCSNPKPHQHFSIAVRELSVSFEQGDGNGKTSDVSMVPPSEVRGLPDRYMASIARWLLPVQR